MTTILSPIVGVASAVATTPVVVCLHWRWATRMLFGLAGLVPATIWAATQEAFPQTLGPYVLGLMIIRAGVEGRRRMNGRAQKTGSR